MSVDPRFDRPDRRVMTICALRVLDAAAEAARDVTIERTPAMRLALGWLSLNGFAKGWQIAEFWRLLATFDAFAKTETINRYCRYRDLSTTIEAWKREAGLSEPIHHEGGNPHGNWLRGPMAAASSAPDAIHDATGIPLSRVYALLNGFPPSEQELATLAALFGCDVAELRAAVPQRNKRKPLPP